MSAEILDRSSRLKTGWVACSQSSTGGVRYNSDIARSVREVLEINAFEFLLSTAPKFHFSSASKRRG
jgi:hypothetical protein